MIKCEKLENGKYRTIFKGTIGDLADELGALIEKFAEEVLDISEREMLDMFCEHYQEIRQAEAQNEADMC